MSEPLALTPKMAAELTPFGEGHIRYLAHNDPSFPAFKNGAHVIIPRRSFEDWLCEQAAARLGFEVANVPMRSRMKGGR